MGSGASVRPTLCKDSMSELGMFVEDLFEKFRQISVDHIP